MKILNKTSLAVSIAAALSGNAMAADDTYRIDNRGQIVEDRVMYSLGGGSVVGAPASFYRPNDIGVGLKWKANMMCGNGSGGKSACDDHSAGKPRSVRVAQ